MSISNLLRKLRDRIAISPLEEVVIPRYLIVALWIGAALALIALQYLTHTQWRAAEILGDPVTVFDPILSNNAAGTWLTHPLVEGNHFFTNHVMLWMIPATVPYWVVDSPWNYFSMVNLAMACCVVPLGMLAWGLTRSAPLVVAALIAFYGNRYVGGIQLSLHSETLTLPFHFLLLLGTMMNRRSWRVIAVIALLMNKEDQPLWIFTWAAWALWSGLLSRREGVLWMGVAVAAFAAFSLTMKLLPAVSGEHLRGFWIAERFGSLGSAAPEVLGSLLSDPAELLRRIFRPTWLHLLALTGGLALMGWRAIPLILPPAMFFFMADAAIFHDLLYYYAYPILPPLFLAALLGARAAGERWPRRAVIHACAVLLTVAGVWGFTQPTVKDGLHLRPFTPDPRMDFAREFIEGGVAESAPDAGVMVQWKLAAFVPRGRQRIAMKVASLPRVDHVFVDEESVPWDLAAGNFAEFRELVAVLENPGGEFVLAERNGAVRHYRRVR